MTTDAPGDRGRRGFALLLVLWALVFVSLLVTQLAATGSREARIALNLTGAAAAEAAADGAVYETIFRLLDASPQHWDLDGKPHRLVLDDGEVTIRIESEAGKVNPNGAPPELLAALLAALDVPKDPAGRLAEAITAWREGPGEAENANTTAAAYEAAGLDHVPPGEPFQTIDELGRVIGMTPDLLARLRPHLTLFQPALPDPVFADPVVRRALSALPNDPDDEHPHSSGLDVVTITADARLKNGGRFIRHAIVRLGGGFERGYIVCEWGSAPAG
jgi:general secretion pathway protein K